MWFSVLKKTVVQLKKISDLWNSESGDWHWLVEKPRPLASLNRDLWKASVPAFSFYFLLALSSIISTLGLLAGSAATIIGAMIIAPLMGPIIGMAYSMVVANRRLLRRSSLTLFTGVVMTIIVSMAIANTIGLRTLSEEILARVNPTLIDLGVAMCAGAAGAFAKCRRSIGDALPGVAIAVALVPPLSVIGIGLSIGSKSVTGGASLLFLTNLISIIFSGGLVFLFHRYGSLERAKKGLFISIVGLTLLGLPLGFSLKTLLIKENVRRSISVLIRRQTLTFSDKDIRTIQVVPQGDELFVEVEVAAAFNSISETQVNLVRDFLENELERPVNLQVKVIPVNYFEAPAD
ncbi:MAG: TIGR00341 family protein [Oscillatoria sp. PMC 1051.18]|nr:TIGR00341 family protein [Oscillatoria sp. PMC 1050.18]MEC5030748.1 TIGR00341 family protein [Oscillatoria sp. PMC 1051.18]